MNKVIIMGRLTADPELRQTQSGISSCRFNVAVNRRFKNEAGEYEADFISCVAWRQTAEFVSRYFNKGSMICLEGTLRTSTYDDKKHPDVKHYATDVFVDNVEFCGSKNESGASQAAQTAPAPQNVTTPQPTFQQSKSASIDFGDLSEFEEVLGDDVPF